MQLLKGNSRTQVWADDEGLIVQVGTLTQRPILIGDSAWDFARIRWDYPEAVPVWAQRFVQDRYAKFFKILHEV
jgi:hypothetical protein